MQICILGLCLGGKDRRVKKGKPPETLGVGSSRSKSAGGPPKYELDSVIEAGVLTGMLI